MTPKYLLSRSVKSADDKVMNVIPNMNNFPPNPQKALNKTPKAKPKPVEADVPGSSEHTLKFGGVIDDISNKLHDFSPVFADDPVVRTLRSTAIGSGIGAAISPKGQRLEGAGHGAITGTGAGLGSNAGIYATRALRDALGYQNREMTGGRFSAEMAASLLGALGGAYGTEAIIGKATFPTFPAILEPFLNSSDPVPV